MVAPMKTTGLEAVRNLLRRNARLYALRRISTHDFRYIEQRLKEVEARIISMREHGVEEPF
jgi:hypothetical protein